jgi:spermidine/putrescine transport system ATP-binding protein
MDAGRVEQIGTPREVYEQPATPFVADFIGSLNAFEIRIDEVVGGYGIARLGERDRVVVPVDAGTSPGLELRVAVRPEHVALGEARGENGTRLAGTVSEIVYLGMYTQLHVDTAAGRIVSHRLADGSVEALERGSAVELAWDADDSYVLGEPLVPA